jgi:large subunit ribosomal protein L7/L12
MSDEQTYDVVLVKRTADKPAVMKAVMSVKPLGLKEAKDLIDNPPSVILKRVGKEKAEQAKAVIEKTGAVAEVRPSS